MNYFVDKDTDYISNDQKIREFYAKHFVIRTLFAIFAEYYYKSL